MFSIQMLVKEAVTMVSRTVISQLREGPQDRPRPKPLVGPPISLASKPIPPLPPVPSMVAPETQPVHQEDGCPACKFHDQVAGVSKLADGLVISASPDGTLPHPQAGTLPLIEVTLRQAAEQVQTLAASRPDLAPQCDQVRQHLTATAAAVPTDGHAGAAEARVLAERLESVWRECYQLTSAYWSPPTAQQGMSSAIEKWYEDSTGQGLDTPTALLRLQEVLSGESK